MKLFKRQALTLAALLLTGALTACSEDEPATMSADDATQEAALKAVTRQYLTAKVHQRTVSLFSP